MRPGSPDRRSGQSVGPDSPAAPALSIIADNARRAQDIAGQILDMSRSAPGKDSARIVDITTAIEEVLKLLSWEITSADIQLVRDFEPVAPCFVDPHRVGQVFVNIIRNALDAMVSGGTLQVKLHQDGDTIRASFIDTGLGIAPDIQDQIFDSFFTTKDRTDERTSGGTGLGLAVSREILEPYGGTIELDSSGDAGTCFTVCLPASDSDDEEDSERISNTEIPTGGRVMIVDDEPDIGEMLRTILEMKGIGVVVAANGEQAVEILRDQEFDAVFVDFAMPGLSGYRLGRMLSDLRPEMPLVYMSGLDIAQDDAITDYIKKPFSLDEFERKLRHVLRDGQ